MQAEDCIIQKEWLQKLLHNMRSSPRGYLDTLGSQKNLAYLTAWITKIELIERDEAILSDIVDILLLTIEYHDTAEFTEEECILVRSARQWAVDTIVYIQNQTILDKPFSKDLAEAEADLCRFTCDWRGEDILVLKKRLIREKLRKTLDTKHLMLDQTSQGHVTDMSKYIAELCDSSDFIEFMEILLIHNRIFRLDDMCVKRLENVLPGQVGPSLEVYKPVEQLSLHARIRYWSNHPASWVQQLDHWLIESHKRLFVDAAHICFPVSSFEAHSAAKVTIKNAPESAHLFTILWLHITKYWKHYIASALTRDLLEIVQTQICDMSARPRELFRLQALRSEKETRMLSQDKLLNLLSSVYSELEGAMHSQQVGKYANTGVFWIEIALDSSILNACLKMVLANECTLKACIESNKCNFKSPQEVHNAATTIIGFFYASNWCNDVFIMSPFTHSSDLLRKFIPTMIDCTRLQKAREFLSDIERASPRTKLVILRLGWMWTLEEISRTESITTTAVTNMLQRIKMIFCGLTAQFRAEVLTVFLLDLRIELQNSGNGSLRISYDQISSWLLTLVREADQSKEEEMMQTLLYFKSF